MLLLLLLLEHAQSAVDGLTPKKLLQVELRLLLLLAGNTCVLLLTPGVVIIVELLLLG